MKCLISVVMPVYGVERWLESAARSVLDQTERSLELILVDDCSPDKSGALCDRLAEEDARVSVVHLSENGGLSHARNEGLARAVGKYVFFMDSDDVIEPNLLQSAVQAAESAQADWLIFGATEEHYDASGRLTLTRRIVPEPRVCRSQADKEAAVISLEKQTLLGYAWNKLYRAGFLRENGLTFQSVELIEDILFNIECARYARVSVVLDDAGYHYARRASGSLTGRVLENYFELNSRRVSMLLALYDDWNAANDSVLDALAAIYARYVVSALERLYDPRRGLTAAERRERARRIQAQPLYIRLRPRFHGAMGLIAGSPLLALPAGWALHMMHAHLGGLFTRLRAKTHKI